MLKTLSILLSISSASAFQNAKTTRSKPIVDSIEFYGDNQPTGFFDPLQVTNNCDEKTLKYMREAELHHGRIAMTAALLLPIIDKLEPDTLAVNALSQSGSTLNNIALGSMGFFEFAEWLSPVLISILVRVDASKVLMSHGVESVY